jgi:hypothetical protein
MFLGGAPGIKCRVDTEAHLAQVGQGAPHSAVIEALLLPSRATFNDFLAIADEAAIIGTGGPEVGGEIAGVDGSNETIWIVNADGSSPVQVTDGTDDNPDWGTPPGDG